MLTLLLIGGWVIGEPRVDTVIGGRHPDCAVVFVRGGSEETFVAYLDGKWLKRVGSNWEDFTLNRVSGNARTELASFGGMFYDRDYGYLYDLQGNEIRPMTTAFTWDTSMVCGNCKGGYGNFKVTGNSHHAVTTWYEYWGYWSQSYGCLPSCAHYSGVVAFDESLRVMDAVECDEYDAFGLSTQTSSFVIGRLISSVDALGRITVAGGGPQPNWRVFDGVVAGERLAILSSLFDLYGSRSYAYLSLYDTTQFMGSPGSWLVGSTDDSLYYPALGYSGSTDQIWIPSVLTLDDTTSAVRIEVRNGLGEVDTLFTLGPFFDLNFYHFGGQGQMEYLGIGFDEDTTGYLVFGTRIDTVNDVAVHRTFPIVCEGCSGTDPQPAPVPISPRFGREFRFQLPYDPSAGISALVEAYNVAGHRVWSETFPVGSPATEIVWDGRDDAGRTVGSGIYYIRVTYGQVYRLKFIFLRT